MKTAIYIRVSKQEQARDGYSIHTQRDRLTAFAHSQDWEIHDYYIDEGRSAKDTDRLELQRMLDDVEEGMIDVVLVFKLDRLTRAVKDLYSLLEQFEKHGVGFRSATEVFDTTTPMGRVFITIVAAMAQWERENLAERVKINMIQMVKEGRYPGGQTAYGYRAVGGKKASSLEIEEDEAEIVKLIFSTYLSGKGAQFIATMLNDMGLLTRRGLRWQQKAIYDILKNTLYYGSKMYAGDLHENYAPAIITREIFDRVQEVREDRNNYHPRRNVPTYIFSGIVRCYRCGKSLVGKTNHSSTGNVTYFFYSCPNKKKKQCTLPLINQVLVEEKFMELIQQHNRKLQRIDTQKDSPETIESLALIKKLDKQIAVIKARKKKWQLAFASDVISLDDLKELTSTDNEMHAALTKQQNDIKAKRATESKSPEELSVILTDFIASWSHLSPEEKKQYARIIVDHFSIDTHDARINQTGKRKVTIPDVKFR